MTTSEKVSAQHQSPDHDQGVTDRCLVTGVSLTGEDWLSRHSNVSSPAQCHQDCLLTKHCRYWTWRHDSWLCYLKSNDGPVVKDVLSVSGTTAPNQGCRRSIFSSPEETISETKVEYCHCVSVSHDLVSGYIDPRALPSSQVGDSADPSKLGRLIRHNACPPGQQLTCSPTDNDLSVSRVSNITECLVYDVRMTVGGHVGVIAHVSDVTTCHSYCLAKPECHYWTWRGETADRKCFLLPRETRVVRRQGSASGTVSRDLGCARPLVTREPEYREDTGVGGVAQCDCVLDSDQDLVGSGLIDPRHLPSSPSVSGRIVNSSKCPAGYTPVCYEPKTVYEDDIAALGLPYGAADTGEARNVPRRQIESNDDVHSIVEEKDNSAVAVSFPQ